MLNLDPLETLDALAQAADRALARACSEWFVSPRGGERG